MSSDLTYSSSIKSLYNDGKPSNINELAINKQIVGNLLVESSGLDGVGDNADLDDDNDGWTDSDEAVCGTDPRDSLVLPDDFDSDMICDVVDDDDDNDGFTDDNDVFPMNAAEWLDTDLDSLGNGFDNKTKYDDQQKAFIKDQIFDIAQ